MSDYLAELQNCLKCKSYFTLADLNLGLCTICLIPDEDLPPPLTEAMFQESFWGEL